MSKIIFLDNRLRYGIIFILLHIIFGTQAQTENNVHLKNEVWAGIPLYSFKNVEHIPYPAITYKRSLNPQSYLKVRFDFSKRNNLIESHIGENPSESSASYKSFGIGIGYERRTALSERLAIFYGPEGGIALNANETQYAGQNLYPSSGKGELQTNSYNIGVSAGLLCHLGKHFATSISYGFAYFYNQMTIKESVNNVTGKSKFVASGFSNTPIMICAILKF